MLNREECKDYLRGLGKGRKIVSKSELLNEQGVKVFARFGVTEFRMGLVKRC
jgi:hypothetical protein